MILVVGYCILLSSKSIISIVDGYNSSNINVTLLSGYQYLYNNSIVFLSGIQLHCNTGHFGQNCTAGYINSKRPSTNLFIPSTSYGNGYNVNGSYVSLNASTGRLNLIQSSTSTTDVFFNTFWFI